MFFLPSHSTRRKRKDEVQRGCSGRSCCGVWGGGCGGGRRDKRVRLPRRRLGLHNVQDATAHRRHPRDARHAARGVRKAQRQHDGARRALRGRRRRASRPGQLCRPVHGRVPRRKARGRRKEGRRRERARGRGRVRGAVQVQLCERDGRALCEPGRVWRARRVPGGDLCGRSALLCDDRVRAQRRRRRHRVRHRPCQEGAAAAPAVVLPEVRPCAHDGRHDADELQPRSQPATPGPAASPRCSSRTSSTSRRPAGSRSSSSSGRQRGKEGPVREELLVVSFRRNSKKHKRKKMLGGEGDSGVDATESSAERGYHFKTPSLTRRDIAERIGRCLGTTKYVLFFGLLLVFVLGLVLFGVGVSSAASERALSVLKIPGIASLPIWMIVLGIFVMLVTLIGALGAQLFNRPLLAIFGVLLGVLLVMEFGVGIAAGVEHRKLPELMSLAWGEAENSTRAYLEAQFVCCGYWNFTDRSATESCVDAANATTCRDALFATAAKLVYAVGSAGVVCCLLEIASLAITIALIVRIRKIQLQYSQVSQDDPVALLH